MRNHVLTALLLLISAVLCACPGKSLRTSQTGGTGTTAATSGNDGHATAGTVAASDPAPGNAEPDDPPQPPDEPEHPEGTVQIDESANGTTVTLHQGQRLELSLSANPSTGYAWAFAREENGVPYQLNQAVLKLVGTQFKLRDSAPPPLPDEPIPPDPPVPPNPGEPQPGDPPNDPPMPGQPPAPVPDGPPGDAEPGDPPPPLVGAGGVEVWTFETPGTGSVELKLEYRRSWEKDVNAASSFKLTVVVEPQEPKQPEPDPAPKPDPQPEPQRS